MLTDCMVVDREQSLTHWTVYLERMEQIISGKMCMG